MLFGYGPSPEIAPLVYGYAVLITAISAFTDWRTGRIPHWVTLPPMVIGPLLHGFALGMEGTFSSLIAMAITGLVPLIMFMVGGMAGGDLKLFVAIGALCGPYIGLEAEMLAFVVASIYAMGRLAWDGRLVGALGNTIFLALNPLLPQRLRRSISPELLHTLRLGGSIFAGTLIALYSRVQVLFL